LFSSRDRSTSFPAASSTQTASFCSRLSGSECSVFREEGNREERRITAFSYMCTNQRCLVLVQVCRLASSSSMTAMTNSFDRDSMYYPWFLVFARRSFKINVPGTFSTLRVSDLPLPPPNGNVPPIKRRFYTGFSECPIYISISRPPSPSSHPSDNRDIWDINFERSLEVKHYAQFLLAATTSLYGTDPYLRECVSVASVSAQ